MEQGLEAGSVDAGGSWLVGKMTDRHGNPHSVENRQEVQDILAGKQEFDVPAERRYLAGEIGDVAQRDRHAALVVGVESHPARAGGIEACEFGLASAHVDCDYAARTLW